VLRKSCDVGALAAVEVSRVVFSCGGDDAAMGCALDVTLAVSNQDGILFISNHLVKQTLQNRRETDSFSSPVRSPTSSADLLPFG